MIQRSTERIFKSRVNVDRHFVEKSQPLNIRFSEISDNLMESRPKDRLR